MRTGGRNRLDEICERREVIVLSAFAEQRELRAMVREVIDLPMVELDGAHCLRWLESPDALRPKAPVTGDVLVFGKPFGDRRWSDRESVSRLHFGAHVIERVAEIIPGECIQNHASGE